MGRVWSVAALAAAISMSAPASAAAQVGLFLGGGATMPTGDFNDVANVGWLGHAGITYLVGQDGLFVGAEGFYGSNEHELEGTQSNLYGGHALIGVNFFNPGEAGPFVAAGAGLLTHEIVVEDTPALDVSESGFGLTGLAGVSFPLGTAAQGSLSASFTRGFGDLDDFTMFAGLHATVGFTLGDSGM